MPEDQFRVTKSPTGYRVELFRRGEPYVTFVDGVTKRCAEGEARALTALWLKISKRVSSSHLPYRTAKQLESR